MDNLIDDNQANDVKYIGFTTVEVAAVNPTRKQLNRLLNIKNSPDDKPIQYVERDEEGNEKVELVFWLYDLELGKYFPYSIHLVKKANVDTVLGRKQFINCVCETAWVNSDNEIPVRFSHFLNNQMIQIERKRYRKALVGEEDLATFLRAWLGHINWNDPDTIVEVDPALLLKEDYSELTDLIDCGYDSPFVALIGVKTNEDDNTRQSQEVYGKAFLPGSFILNINNGFQFRTPYSSKVWANFEEIYQQEFITGTFYKLQPLKEYSKEEVLDIKP